jgi:hypothetical protein
MLAVRPEKQGLGGAGGRGVEAEHVARFGELELRCRGSYRRLVGRAVHGAGFSVSVAFPFFLLLHGHT